MGHRDVLRGEWCRAAEVQGQRPWDACRARLPGLDAWDGVRRDAMADARRALRLKPDAGAGKLAARELDGRARDDARWVVRAQPAERPPQAALCK